jgi:uncharacterized membrane protein YqjE
VRTIKNGVEKNFDFGGRGRQRRGRGSGMGGEKKRLTGILLGMVGTKFQGAEIEFQTQF